MNNDISKLGDTISPKSDQLNAEDMLTGPITVTVTGVSRGSPDQPVNVHIEGRQPFRPCKTCRRILVAAWSEDGNSWVGRRMTLYCDPDVSYGGVKVGGIRISHLSDMPGDMTLILSAKRGKREPHTVRRLIETVAPGPAAATANRTHADRVARVLSAYAKQGLTPDQVEEWIGRPLTEVTDDDFVQFREHIALLKREKADALQP